MDTKNQIQEHSKIKLSVYKKYLERYLSIMLLKTTPYKSIAIIEPFAGKGISDNNEKGSALIAQEAITRKVEEARKNSKVIYLFLNDIDRNNAKELERHLGDSQHPNYKIKVYNQDANDFIKLEKGIQKVCHILYFIDPFGYRQIKSNTYGENLFGRPNVEILIFIPINSIYRFLRKENKAEQLKPVARFLSDLCVSERNAQASKSVEEFASTITEALKKKADTRFAYHKIIKSKYLKHTLFFVTKHVLGAEKFLEAVEQINKKETIQGELFYELISTPAGQKLVSKIENETNLNNKDIYKYAIEIGLLSKDVRKVLKKLEDENKIEITSLGSFKRNRKAFPVDYKSYKEINPKILVKYNEK